jgi:hypothetical protein
MQASSGAQRLRLAWYSVIPKQMDSPDPLSDALRADPPRPASEAYSWGLGGHNKDTISGAKSVLATPPI